MYLVHTFLICVTKCFIKITKVRYLNAKVFFYTVSILHHPHPVRYM